MAAFIVPTIEMGKKFVFGCLVFFFLLSTNNQVPFWWIECDISFMPCQLYFERHLEIKNKFSVLQKLLWHFWFLVYFWANKLSDQPYLVFQLKTININYHRNDWNDSSYQNPLSPTRTTIKHFHKVIPVRRKSWFKIFESNFERVKRAGVVWKEIPWKFS